MKTGNQFQEKTNRIPNKAVGFSFGNNLFFIGNEA
jgi:hypothetical protein